MDRDHYHLRNSDLRSVSVIVNSAVALQLLNDLAQVVRVDLVPIESVSSRVHELYHFHLGGVRPDALLLHLYFVLLDPLHLVGKLLAVIVEDFLSFVFVLLVLGAQDGVQYLFAALLAVIDAKADLHVLVGLQITIGQLLEEVKDNILIVVHILVHVRLHFLLCALAALHQLEKLAELYIHVIVNRRNHFFNLLARVDQPQCNERVLQLVHSDGLRAILVQIVEAVVKDGHLLLVKVYILRLAVLAKPLPLDAFGLILNERTTNG